ncbi:MAG: calcium/sodium antiporter [Candidatus Saccharimonadales bacterium]
MELVLAVVAILASLYLLAVLTEDFFIPSIDRISQKLRLSSDAAGATLLAAGSSAPEFFTAIIAVFGLTGGGEIADVGTGTIVGSAVFNVLVIIGAAALYKAVKLQWQPVIRDMVFYVATIIMLLVAFSDGKITLFEALAFVLTYGVYIWTVVKWRKWLKYDDVALEESEAKVRKGLGMASYKLLRLIIPDARLKPKLYLVSFLLAIAGIGGLSFVLVAQVVVIADLLHINATFLALTVVAAGTSVPDMIGSMVVAKQGRGDMAVSNAIGSNVFNILFGLGLPWLLVLTFSKEFVPVGTANLTSSVLLLLATVIAIIFLLVLRKWRIGQKSGLALIALYIAYCVYVAITVA